MKTTDGITTRSIFLRRPFFQMCSSCCVATYAVCPVSSRRCATAFSCRALTMATYQLAVGTPTAPSARCVAGGVVACGVGLPVMCGTVCAAVSCGESLFRLQSYEIYVYMLLFFV